MDKIPRFKKMEVLLLGIVLPVLLSGYTVLLLLSSEAVFGGAVRVLSIRATVLCPFRFYGLVFRDS